MNASNLKQAQQATSERIAVCGDNPEVLTEIYQENVNIAIWQRTFDAGLEQNVAKFLGSKPGFNSVMTLAPQDANRLVGEALGSQAGDDFRESVAELVDMFCCLFELKRAGLRMAAMTRAMCPRFHVDKIPCRLVTTYGGVATQWLPHESVDRALLGRKEIGLNSDGLTDVEAGLYKHEHDIQQLKAGDVALLKGELWIGNEGAGLVHRSPQPPDGASRLVLTLDISR